MVMAKIWASALARLKGASAPIFFERASKASAGALVRAHELVDLINRGVRPTLYYMTIAFLSMAWWHPERFVETVAALDALREEAFAGAAALLVLASMTGGRMVERITGKAPVPSAPKSSAAPAGTPAPAAKSEPAKPKKAAEPRHEKPAASTDNEPLAALQRKAGVSD